MTAMQYAVTYSKDPHRRADTRLEVCLAIEVTYPDGQLRTLCSKNISTTGLVLNNGEHPIPAIGSILQLQVAPELGLSDAPLVDAKVVSSSTDSFTIEFIQP